MPSVRLFVPPSRLLLALVLLAPVAHGQVAPADSLEAPAADSLSTPLPVPADTVETAIVLPVPQAPAAEGGLEQPVSYTARDSLRVVLAPRNNAPSETGDVVSLFGEVQALYEGATITAGRVDYESASEVLRASAIASDSGTVGVPEYAGEEGQFSGRTVVYNLRTQRGRVTGARTQIEDGYLLGGILKQQNQRVVFAQDAAYTTCELDHPHYALEAGRIKVVDGERVYTGPVRLRLLGVPMPLILPFGYFPAAEGRRSGPLAVKFEQDTDFGLTLKNLGWYFAISDYLDAQVSGTVGTRGSYQLAGVANYNRRYAYSGRVSLSYGRLRSGESTDPTFSLRTPVGLQWSHNQTFPAGQRLTASVNLQSASQRLVATDVAEQIRSSTSSSVSYAQQWPTVGRSLTVSAQAFQDFANNSTSATLPQLSFSQRRLFPFRRGRDDRWFEKISVEYSANAQNAFAYTPISDSTGISAIDALFSESAFREGVCAPDDASCDQQRFDYQLVQRLPINATFSVPRYNLTFGPSLTMTETWTDEEILRTYDSETQRVTQSRQPGFTAFRRFVASASASTELYGTFPIRVGSVDGIRHTVSPRLALSFEPDYALLGFVREVQADSTGRTQRYAINPTIPTDPTRSLSFSVNNTIVARTVRTDSTGAEERSTRQVLSFSLSGGYNFAAEERPFSDLQSRFTTMLFGFNASGDAQFSAYAPDTLVTQTPLTYFDATGRPLRLTRIGLRLDRSFRSRQQTGARDERAVFPDAGLAVYDPAVLSVSRAPVGYLDYGAPWAFSLGLTLNQTSNAFGEPTTTATLGLNQFNAQLTPNWAVSGSSGLDLTTLEPTQTRLSLRRDLHCWEMALNWQPIGQTKFFSVSLYVKSGLLRDFLRLDVPNSTSRPSVLSGF